MMPRIIFSAKHFLPNLRAWAQLDTATVTPNDGGKIWEVLDISQSLRPAECNSAIQQIENLRYTGGANARGIHDAIFGCMGRRGWMGQVGPTFDTTGYFKMISCIWICDSVGKSLGNG